MRHAVTCDTCYPTFGQFKARMLGYMIEEVPINRASLRDSVSDGFRVINPKDSRIVM